MKQFKPVFDRFKNEFFNGLSRDPECEGKKAAAPRKRAAPKQSTYERIVLPDSEDEESKEPVKKMLKDNSSSQASNKRMKTTR